MHTKESLIYRPFIGTSFMSKRLISKRKDLASDLDAVSLIDMIKNPQIALRKTEGILIRIGICSEDSLYTSKPSLLVTRLIVDYDNISKDKDIIHKFVDKFKKYSFILYTTFSSTHKVPKFRVIFKLKEPIESVLMEDREYIEYLKETFKIGNEYPDESCFLSTQGQLAPIVKYRYNYVYAVNKGKKFKLKGYEDIVKDNSNFYKDVKRGYEIFKEKGSFISNPDITIVSRKETLSYLNKYNKSQKPYFSMSRPKVQKEIERIKLRVKPYKVKAESIDKKALLRVNNKHQFKTRYVPKLVSGKISWKEFCDSWEYRFGEVLTENKEWYKKVRKFYKKVLGNASIG